jgi:hypothetical protein
VSIVEFQRALCDMTLRPALAAAVRRAGVGVLADYELSANEQRRLIDVVGQPGMAINCTLARANRFAPIADAFPLTCAVLKPHLRALLDELWGIHTPDTYQLAGEAAAFAAFLGDKLARGECNHQYAEEIFRYECAAWELIRARLRSSANPSDAAAPRSVTVRFEHDPRILIPRLESDESLPLDLPGGDYQVRVTLQDDMLVVEPL